MFYLGLDPGKDKCGLALVNEDGQVLVQKIVFASSLEEELLRITNGKDVVVILGDGTTSEKYLSMLTKHGFRVNVIRESFSTLDARELYFKEKGYGWQIILPKGLRNPNIPLDDYAARVLVNRFLSEATSKEIDGTRDSNKKDKPGY
ncbi:MAG TPA: hypothetical protein GX522_06745 [Firmicutes bacterium]|jgi:RNase H-fold protein (predicted Holliday junction resolvase)|nr:hypothetical protein [Bacillota bacterium]